MRFGLGFLSATLFSLLPISGAAAPHVDSPGDAVDNYLERLALYGFSGGVAVEKDGKLLTAKGYGAANRAAARRFTADTPSYVASVSKMFIAAAVLKLSERSTLNLDESISAYFPNVPEDKRAITLRMLLNHSSGLSASSVGQRGMSLDEFVKHVLGEPLSSRPGSTFEYSNNGYGLAAAILERTSGRPIAALLRSKIFAPAGMTHSWLVSERPRTAGKVIAYRSEMPMGDASMSYRQPSGWEEIAGSGVITSVRDLYRWHLALSTGRILSPATLASMQEGTAGYGLGVYTGMTDRGARRWGHGGLMLPAGWNASYRELPDDRIFIAVASNSYAGVSLGEFAANGVEALLLGDPPVTPPPTRPCITTDAGATGLYRTTSGANFGLAQDSGVLLLEPLNQKAQNLLSFGNEESRPELDIASALAVKALTALIDGETSDHLNAPLRGSLEATYEKLRKRLGQVRSLSAISVANGEAIDSFVKIEMDQGEADIRLTIEQGRVLAASDRAAYGPDSFNLERARGRVRLTCPDPAHFFAFDFVTGEPMRFARATAREVPWIRFGSNGPYARHLHEGIVRSTPIN